MAEQQRETPTAAVVVLVLSLVFVLGVLAFVAMRRDAGVLFFLALPACASSFQLGVWLEHSRRSRV